MTPAPRASNPCIGNDPRCPCQDGLLCHYVDDPVGKTPAMTIPPRAAAEVEGEIEKMATAILKKLDYAPMVRRAGTRLDRQETRRRILVEAITTALEAQGRAVLREYGQHKAGCMETPDQPCSCGLADQLGGR